MARRLRLKQRTNGHKNGHSNNLAIPADDEVIAPEGFDIREQAPVEWQLMFPGRDAASLPSLAEIPPRAIIPICVMRMQARATRLTGGLDDPDLLEEFIKDFEELSIGQNRLGREEGAKMAQIRMIRDSQSDDDADFF